MELPNSVRETQRILDGGSDFSAPLAGVSAGRLEFRRGASRVTIRGEAMEELFRAHFDGPVPEVAVDGGTVAIRYRPLSSADWASFLWTPDDHRADIVLNSALPWDLEVRGGVSRLDANLSGLRLAGFEIRGGASNVELVLDEPRGIGKLALDDQRFGAVGGQTRVTTGAWRQATAGYDIEIAGGASHLTVEGR